MLGKDIQMTKLAKRIDDYLLTHPEDAINLWNDFIGCEDNGALHTGRLIYKMEEFQSLFVNSDIETSVKALQEATRNDSFNLKEKYVWLCEDDTGIEPSTYETFDALHSDYREELAELITEHKDAIIEEAHKTKINSELVKVLELTVADKYKEALGIDAIKLNLCPANCGFSVECCSTSTNCTQCRRKFWELPFSQVSPQDVN